MPVDEIRPNVTAAPNHADIAAAIDAIYADIDSRLGKIRPRCGMSGRCCHFEAYGHRLFVTTAELAHFAIGVRTTPELEHFSRRPDGGGCRFQDGKLCRAHAHRPMGCRLYFCDERCEQELQLVYEQMHHRIKQLHDAMGVAYVYVEWRKGLEAMFPSR